MTDDEMSDLEGDDNQCDILPPAKKYKQGKLSFFVSGSDDHHEGDEESSATGSKTAAAHGHGRVQAGQHVTTVCGSCTSDCCAGGLTPFQPTDPATLEKLRKKQGDRYCCFSSSWYSTFPWLTVCVTRGKAFCVVCRYCSEKNLLGLSKKGDDAFTLVGFDNWKKARERFNTHALSDTHKEAVLKIELSKQESVHALINKQAMAEQKVRQQMLLKQISSLKYLLRQGLAVRGHDDLEGNLLQLLKLRSSDCTELTTWIRERRYFSPVILNEQIFLMGLTVLRGLLNDIKAAQWFSIIVDEATDISHKEQLTLCVRWVDMELTIHEDPLKLVHVPKTDANTLTSVVKDCLIRFSLPISQCRGQAYDGASNMSGHLNGVAAQIEKDVPAALFLHCFAHCTNLCLQSIGRQCAPIRYALDLVMGISQLIRYSPKRTSLFLSLQSQLSPGSTTSLKPLCPTRWTVRTAAISAVLTNYSVLCAALEEINIETHDEYGMKAGGYLAQMENFSTYFGLKLSHLVFSGAEQLSLTLQGKDTTIQEASMAAELMIQHLQQQRSDTSFDLFYSKVVEDSNELTSPPSLPRHRRPPRRVDDSTATAHEFATPEDYFRKQYFEVLDLLINELKRRFQQKRGMPVVTVLEKLLFRVSFRGGREGSLAPPWKLAAPP